MNLYISGSNRKNNSYRFLKKLKNDDDIFYSLADLNIKNCLGCNMCAKNDMHTCVLNDDMRFVYDAINECDKIIFMFPIYMNHMPGIFKNFIDRFNPYCSSEKLRGKKVYLLTVGQMSEEEQEEVVEDIKNYFNGICEFMYFDFEYLYNFTSGDILEIDDIDKMYDNEKLEEIIADIKNKINQ